MDSAFWYLEQHDIETILAPNELEALAFAFPKVSIAKGESIFNHSKDQFFFIVKGKVIVGAFNDQGQASPINILKSEDLLRQKPTAEKVENRGYAIASIDTIGCYIDTESFKSKLKDHNVFTAMVMKMMGAKNKDMERRLESLLFKDSKTRIIDFILHALEKRGQRIGYEHVIRNFSTHQEVADMTATSRQTVTMILNELRNDNIISFDRKRMLIRDIEKLKSLTK